MFKLKKKKPNYPEPYVKYVSNHTIEYKCRHCGEVYKKRVEERWFGERTIEEVKHGISFGFSDGTHDCRDGYTGKAEYIGFKLNSIFPSKEWRRWEKACKELEYGNT